MLLQSKHYKKGNEAQGNCVLMTWEAENHDYVQGVLASVCNNILNVRTFLSTCLSLHMCYSLVGYL